jgi:uncharacterized protein (TIGR00106 family)
MSVIIQFAMFPTDKGSSVSDYVSQIIKMIHQNGIDYKLTAMGTIIETETLEQGLEIINKAYKILEPSCDRVYSTATIDMRKSQMGRLEGKVNKIESLIGEIKK